MQGRQRADSVTEVNFQRNLEDVAEQNRVRDLRWVMSDPRGRRVIAAIVRGMDDADGVAYDDHGRADPIASAFDSGMLQVAFDINGEVRAACPDEWTLMQAESIEQASIEQAEESET